MLLCAFAFAGGVLVVVFCEGRATHKMRDLRAFFVWLAKPLNPLQYESTEKEHNTLKPLIIMLNSLKFI